jgi:hypothetical protein
VAELDAEDMLTTIDDLKTKIEQTQLEMGR